MTFIVFTDDNNGMTFLGKRLTRDRTLVRRLAGDHGGILYISPFSESLFAFPDAPEHTVSSDPAAEAGKDDACLIETAFPYDAAEKADRLIIYGWNRLYPSDERLALEPERLGMRLEETTEFAGSSHKRITRRVYVK